MLTSSEYQDGQNREIAMVPKWLQQDLLREYVVDGAIRSVEMEDIVGASLA